MKNQRAVGACLVLCMSIVGACGGGSSDTNDEAATTTTTGTGTTETSAATDADNVVLVDVGVDLPTGVVEFGEAMDDAANKLTAALGPPTEDTGLVAPRRPYGTCPGTKVRALRFYGGALELLFGDAGETSTPGNYVFHSWVLTSNGSVDAAPKASVLIGDVTTFDFGVGTTVKQFEEGLGDEGGYSFEVFDSAAGPTFVIANEAAGNDPPAGSPASIVGELTGDAGTPKLIQGGAGCSE